MLTDTFGKMDSCDTFFYRRFLANITRRGEFGEDEESQKRKLDIKEDGTDLGHDILSGIELLVDEKERKARAANRGREHGKVWWSFCYTTWSDEDFKLNMRVERETFELILHVVRPSIEKQPTNLNPEPTTCDRQLALTIYRLAHGCSFLTLQNLFGVSVSLAGIVFNHVCRVLVREMYDQYVRLPETLEEWTKELSGFIENYEFPCIAAWGGFHVHFSNKLKNVFSFKKRYVANNFGLVGYNNRFLNTVVGVPGSTHDAKLLRNSSIYEKIQTGETISNRTILFGNFGQVPLITLGDSVFPRYSWLVKSYHEDTKDPQQRYFNKKLCGARAVTGNAHGMLKGRWRILDKKPECRLKNVKYVIMTCVMLHNLCIELDDHCQPRWQVEVEQISGIPKQVDRYEDKIASTRNCMKISNWLWEQNKL